MEHAFRYAGLFRAIKPAEGRSLGAWRNDVPAFRCGGNTCPGSAARRDGRSAVTAGAGSGKTRTLDPGFIVPEGNNIAEGFRDYVDFLKGSARYQTALAAGVAAGAGADAEALTDLSERPEFFAPIFSVEQWAAMSVTERAWMRQIFLTPRRPVTMMEPFDYGWDLR